MKKVKRILSQMMVLVMLITSIGAMPVVASAEEDTAIDVAGWYLESYKLVINTKETSGTFMQGGNFKNIVSINDLDGNVMPGLESYFENDINLNYGRYGEDGTYFCGYSQNISWDSPEDYYAEGTMLSLTGVTNQEVSHLTWSCRNISVTFNMQTLFDTYTYKLLNSDGSDQYGIGTEDATVTTNKAIPKAIKGDRAYLIINFDYNSKADSQAIYTYVWKAADKPIKAKTYKPEVSKKGWYLTDYQFNYVDVLYYEGGGSMIDVTKAFDANGDKADTKLENDIYLYSERYFGSYKPENFGIGVRSEIKWDSPASYIPAGATIDFKGFSNTVLATSSVWGAKTTHWSAGMSGFSTEIIDPNGNSWPAATESVSMKSAVALPEGTDGQVLNAYFQIISLGTATYTYTWKNAEQPPTLTKSTVTLYMSGSNKQLTYQIGLKNVKGYTVTYKSRNKSVATVNSKGLVTGKKAGTANILVTIKKGSKTVSKTLKVVVKKK